MSCRLMDRLVKIEGVKELPETSVESIRVIICSTCGGICKEKYTGKKNPFEKKDVNS